MPDSARITLTVLALCIGGSVLAVVIAYLRRSSRSCSQDGMPPPPSGTDAVWAYDVGESAVDTSRPPSVPSGKVAVWPYRQVDWLWMGMIVLLFGALGMGAAAVKGGAPPTITAAGLIETMAFQIFLATVTLAVMVKRIHPVEWLGLRWREWRWALVLGPACVLGVWVASIVINLGGYHALMVKLGLDNTQEAVKLLKSNNDPAILVLMSVAAVLVAPICEEIIFRGYLYPAAKRFAGRWVAMLASAGIFAAAHGSLAQLPQLFVLGVILVLAYEFTQSIWAPIAIHLCNNAATVLLLFALRLSPYGDQL